jgi:hypothetical protein
MKSQARPFTVEVKSKRRPLQASHTNWSTVIDEPAPEDVPSRDIREDAADTPWAVASRVFSAFATAGIFRAPSAAESTPREQPEQAATEGGRTGRILPSLLPLRSFDAAPVQEDRPLRNAPKPKRPRKRAVTVAEQREAPEPTDVAADPTFRPTIAPEVSLAETPSPRPARTPNRRRAEARVRAGEGWKRRRLPKACW